MDGHWFLANEPGFYRYTLSLEKSGWVIDRVDSISAQQFFES